MRASPIAIAISSADDDLIVEVNPAFERLFGVENAAVVGQSLPAMLGASSHGPVRELEIQARERCQLRGRQCVVTYIQDLTHTRSLEAALRDSEDKFVKVFRMAPFSISIADLERDRYVDINDGFERLFGVRREQVVGRPVGEVSLWTYEEERQQYVNTLRRDGAVHGMLIHGRRSDGTTLIGEASGLVVKLGGKRCLLTFARDLTEQYKAQQTAREIETQLRETQKLEALGVLASGIAHDFNNILGAIMAFTELIQFDLDDPQALHTNLSMLRQANERAKELVQQILLFSRRKKHERKPVRIGPAVREALRLLRSTLPPTIEIRDEIDLKAPMVLADPAQIHQVVMNLATNAVHAMADQKGRLTVQLRAADVSEHAAKLRPELRPGPNVLLSVSDTGCGMDAEIAARIFEPFFTTKREGEGTGLGLAVVQSIATEHEAAIVVHSQPSQGTTFELYFPEHPAQLSEPKLVAMSPTRGRGERVLVVDDEPALRYAVARLLERLGYVPTTCASAEDALERLAHERGAFDLILTDLTMPKMNGVELAKQILAHDPSARIVVMTGYSASWNAETLREVGICDLLSKPISTLELSRTLRAALDEPQTSLVPLGRRGRKFPR